MMQDFRGMKTSANYTIFIISEDNRILQTKFYFQNIKCAKVCLTFTGFGRFIHISKH